MSSAGSCRTAAKAGIRQPLKIAVHRGLVLRVSGSGFIAETLNLKSIKHVDTYASDQRVLVDPSS